MVHAYLGKKGYQQHLWPDRFKHALHAHFPAKEEIGGKNNREKDQHPFA